MLDLQEKAQKYAENTFLEQDSARLGFCAGYKVCEKEHEEKANYLLSALEQIANAPLPYNNHENNVFVAVAKKLSNDAISFYKSK